MEHFQKLLLNLKNRESMYVKGGYIGILNFIEGYLFCYKDWNNIDVSSDFQSWLEAKMETQFSLRWGYYILQVFANNNERLAKEFLFDYWFEYLAENFGIEGL